MAKERKKERKSKYEIYSKEKLIAKLQQLEKKRYGLVWEDKPEDIADQCERELPVLIEDKSKEIFSDPKKSTHYIFEGDNYHTLFTLNFTHKKKIDVIYIDPPYNTGNNDFIYNDSFVDKVDRYRHSKWLSFMNKRLRLAKNLLKDSGVVFISIGEEEQSQLKMLCDKVFGQYNFVANVPRVAKKTSDKGTYFKPTKDYILVYAKSISKLDGFGLKKTDDIKKYKFEDEVGIYKKNGASLYQPSLDSRPNQRYWIECPDGSFVIPPGNNYPTEHKDGAFIKPADNNDKVWRWSWMSYLKNKDKLIFTPASKKSPLINEFGKQSKWNIYDKVYWSSLEGATNLPEDIIYDYKNSSATKHLLDMGIKFSFSKPYELIEYLIDITQKNKNITVLDFFAGSGSAGEAVLELNNKDDGNRQFILCTNNENQICENVTYPRIEKVINGYDYKGKVKTKLLEKKLSFSNIYKNVKQKEDESEKDFKIRKEKDVNENIIKIGKTIDKAISSNLLKYDDIEKEFKNNTIKIYGVNNVSKFKKGIPANVKYFKTDFVPFALTDNDKRTLVAKSTELLCIAESTFEVVHQNRKKLDFAIFKNEAKQTAIIYDEDCIEECCFELNKTKLKNKTIIYVFSYDHIYEEEDFENLNIGFIIKPIPEAIINVYRKISKLKNK